MSLHDPEFETFKHAYQEARFSDALLSVKKLLEKYPQSIALYWHHAKVLEKLQRFEQARLALNKVLKLRSDFVPALILQVQLDFHDDSSTDAENEIFNHGPEQKERARFDIIEQRLYKILSIDPNAVDALHMLSGILRSHEGNAHIVKANQLLNRAINLAPKRVDLIEDRANSFLANTIEEHNENLQSDANDIVTASSGAHYYRNVLEQALVDFQRCYRLSHQHRYGLHVGSILHDLGRFDEAVAIFDQVLAQIPDDDPYRAIIIERRARSDHSGDVEREKILQTLKTDLTSENKKQEKINW